MYLPLAFPLTPHIPHYMTSSHPKSLLLTYFLYSLYRTIAIPQVEMHRNQARVAPDF